MAKKQISKSGFEKLEKELNFLVTVRRAEMAQKLKEARAQGDLSENAEYDEAKNEQAILEAQIAEVSKGTTQNNLSYLVTALLPNKEARLLAGMSGKIRFEESASELSDSTATGEHLVCIPQTALCNRPTVGSYVWTVHPESGIVSQRKVSVSKLLPHGNAGITAGLQPGEIVATSSLRFLSDGMKVKIQ